VAVVVTGGAVCLLTNGIHWVDFATELFAGPPRQVLSTACGDAINPRSPDLLLYGGTAVWDFDRRREAVISFNNRSSVELRARVYYRDAVAEIDSDLTVAVRRRDPAVVRRYPGVTRTGSAGELLFEGALPGVLAWSDGVRMALTQLVRGEAAACPGSVGAAAVAACAGALAAVREGRVVELPIAPTSAWWDEPWPIS
jgi:predicted dehydrogenase